MSALIPEGLDSIPEGSRHSGCFSRCLIERVIWSHVGIDILMDTSQIPMKSNSQNHQDTLVTIKKNIETLNLIPQDSVNALSGIFFL
jgi:hypothetical protein